jgi:hypothetical protein
MEYHLTEPWAELTLVGQDVRLEGLTYNNEGAGRALREY